MSTTATSLGNVFNLDSTGSTGGTTSLSGVLSAGNSTGSNNIVVQQSLIMPVGQPANTTNLLNITSGPNPPTAVGVPLGSMYFNTTNSLVYIYGSTGWTTSVTSAAALSAVLAAGNTTGGSNIIFTTGDTIKYISGIAIGGNNVAATSTGTGSGAIGPGASDGGYANSLALFGTVNSANQIMLGGTSHTVNVPGGIQMTTPVATSATIGMLTINSTPGTPTGAAPNGTMVYDSAGNKFWIREGGTWVMNGNGTVTSVDLTAPADMFTVSGNPITGAGTLALAKVSQTANRVFAGPSSGPAAAPTFRALTSADLPAGTGTVTSVGLNAPAEFFITGSPVTGSGTLGFLKVSQNANLVYAGPTTGAAAAPGFRALVAADIPGGVGIQTLAQVLVQGNTTGGTAINVQQSSGSRITFTGAIQIDSNGGSIKVGNFASAGLGAVSMGNSAFADGPGSVAFGDSANVSAGASLGVAVGNNTNISTGIRGVAVGYLASVNGDRGVAVGASSVAVINSVSLGSSANSSQQGNICIGYQAYDGGFTNAGVIGASVSNLAADRITMGNSTQTIYANNLFQSVKQKSAAFGINPQNAPPDAGQTITTGTTATLLYRSAYYDFTPTMISGNTMLLSESAQVYLCSVDITGFFASNPSNNANYTISIRWFDGTTTLTPSSSFQPTSAIITGFGSNIVSPIKTKAGFTNNYIYAEVQNNSGATMAISRFKISATRIA